MRTVPTSTAEAASDIVEQHGIKARQHVVDQIVRAIRAHDIADAKHWEAVGRHVDLLLAA